MVVKTREKRYTFFGHIKREKGCVWMEWTERCWAEVDLGALRQNYRRLRSTLAPGQKYLAVVKADAYGHGAVPVSLALQQEGADWFGVASLEEGEELRRGGITRPVLIFGYTPPQYAGRLAAGALTQGVFSPAYAAALGKAAGAAGCRVDFHLMVDSGMGRLGLRPWEQGSLEEARTILGTPGLRCTGTFTHFAVADELGESSAAFTQGQFDCFAAFCRCLAQAGLNPGLLHCANSAGTLLRRETQVGMCRFGIVNYGLSPSDELTGHPALPPLEPVMSLRATVAMVKEIRPGDTLSYGRLYTAPGPRTIATVAIGYADGYPRCMWQGGRALVRGRSVPIAGRVCMDQLMLDVTGVPGVAPGDTVTLAGRDGGESISWDEVAEKSGTVSYERICGISKRVPRVYREAD